MEGNSSFEQRLLCEWMLFLDLPEKNFFVSVVMKSNDDCLSTGKCEERKLYRGPAQFKMERER